MLTHSFSLPEPDGSQMRLNIGAAMMQVQPVINGSALPERLGAYTPGVWDLTHHVLAGTNL